MKKTFPILSALMPSALHLLLSAILAIPPYFKERASDGGIIDLDFGYPFYFLVALWLLAPLVLIGLTVLQVLFLIRFKNGKIEKTPFIVSAILAGLLGIACLAYYLIFGFGGFFGIYSGFFNQLFH